MSLSDARNLRLAGLAAGLCALFALSGCQVKPLYATDTGTAQAMASIDFSEADDRVELEVRNNLVFLAGGGASEPVNPEYDVDFNVTTRYIGVLLDLKYTDVKVELTSPIGLEFAQAIAPIPTIGFVGRGYVARNVAIGGELSFFRLPGEYEDYDGKYTDVDFYGTVNFTNNVGATLGYRSVDVFYKNRFDNGALKFSGIYISGVVRF